MSCSEQDLYEQLRKALTPEVVNDIASKRAADVIRLNLAKPSVVFVFTFKSMRLLLCHLQQNQDDTSFHTSIEDFHALTFEEAKQKGFGNKTLLSCDPKTQFCVIIASLTDADTGKIHVHSTSCMKLK